jgi:catechol 2,3-dioxygenase-like lactoylglutathione lyase family enzyme
VIHRAAGPGRDSGRGPAGSTRWASPVQSDLARCAVNSLSVIDHLALQVRDPVAAAAFYTRVFAALGVREFRRYERPEGLMIGLCAADGVPQLWFGPLVDPGVRPVHLALTAPSDDAVDAVYNAALDAGAELLHAPRLWPEYHAGYYGVFLRDLDGNNVEAVN